MLAIIAAYDLSSGVAWHGAGGGWGGCKRVAKGPTVMA